jgi:hypothetical protein
MIWTSKKNATILTIKKSILEFYKKFFLRGLHLWICYDLAQSVLTPYQIFPNEFSFLKSK